jgi:type IX secretion system PorP/SprF family membrane protein
VKKLKYSFILFCIVVADSFSQDPTFSQFYANALYLAPSFAGATEEYRFSINYRNQWPAVPGVFHTYSISFDKALVNFNSGIGVLATYDVAGSGDLSTTNIGLLYSYDFNLNENWHIRPGVNFKFTYLGLNIYKLIFASQMTGSGTVPTVYPPPLITLQMSTLPPRHWFIMTGFGVALPLIICLTPSYHFTAMNLFCRLN